MHAPPDWARELEKLGHTVKLMAPQFVKPYVKTNKNDIADTEAICEAVSRPTMRFVPTKTGKSNRRSCPCTGLAKASSRHIRRRRIRFGIVSKRQNLVKIARSKVLGVYVQPLV